MIRTYLHIILLSFLLFSCNKKPNPIESKPIEIDFTAALEIPKNQFYAGEDINIIAQLNKRINKKKFVLFVHSPFGSKSYSIIPESQKFIFTIPASETTIAGKRELVLSYEGTIVAKESLYIRSREAVNKVESYNGPKSLFVEDDDGAMIVNIPHDQYGNPLENKAKVSYNINFNGVNNSTKEKFIDHLLSYHINNAGPEKGKYLIGVQTDKAYSGEQEILIEAGMPANLKIELIRAHPFADARQFVQVKTKPVKDKLGNIVSDGTTINFVVTSNGAVKNLFQSFTVSGIANVYIENPQQAESWEIVGTLYGSVVSNKIEITFEKYVKTFEVSKLPEDKTFKIGPVFGNLDQLVPDGTPVKISLQGSTHSDVIFIEQGQAFFTIPFQWECKSNDELEVLIGGVIQTIRLDGKE